jgi:hypothetical protein
MDFDTLLLTVVFSGAFTVLYTALRIKSEKSYTRQELVKKAVTDFVLIASVTLAVAHPEIIRQTRDVLVGIHLGVYVALVVIGSAIMGSNMYVDRMPKLPRVVFIGHLIMTILVFSHLVRSQYVVFDFFIVDEIFIGITGFVVWVLLQIGFAVVTSSILQKRPDVEEDTGEYGDEHIVGDILDEPSEGEK